MKSKKIVILTGAGISAESGIETFRAAGGLWENHRVEDVATPEGFAKDPELVHRFYNLRRAALKTVKPNAAHVALAKLEDGLKQNGGQLTLVTQNVDDLHERGGTKEVIHMHGILTSMLCGTCEHRWEYLEDASPHLSCPKCYVKNTSRPDIVWFGEMPYAMHVIEERLSDCDLFVSIGTSGAVYPAAGFVQMASSIGKATLELNLERSQGSHFFDESRLGAAGTLVPQWVDEVLKV
ncbi:NAD-dependent deacylase [Hellea balneolensis]|uniref:NAD-dependent deacylase n=1 Tax=Hellea balneolensis TaxID=287478 RepID=UPI000409598F|nr:NAD-dependent deacylase [Hellea balneolensis]